MRLARFITRLTKHAGEPAESDPAAASEENTVIYGKETSALDYQSILIQATELCVKCSETLQRTSIFLKKKKKAPPFLHIKYHNIQSFEASIRAGCRLCKMLYGQPTASAFSDWNPQALDDPFELTITCDVESKIGTMINFVLCSSASSGPDKLYTTVVVATVARKPPKLPAPGRPLGSLTFSAANAPLVQHWLQKCATTHKSCSESRVRSPTLPTRLVDVLGGSSGNGPPQLRVFDSHHSGIQYVALSHCWGKLKFPTLTQNNLEAFKISIPLEQLSKTFQDCIAVTRQLGFRYLWIDSLCIIQDDREDWARESVRMSSVYGGSSLTIAASAAPNGSHGCIYEREPADIRPCAISIGKRSFHYSLEDWSTFYRNSESSVLGKRAWVFQERFLSPRVLYMGSKQLYWHCREDISCESNPNGFLQGHDKRHLAVWRSSWDVNQRWQKVVEEFSGGELSYDSDKLIAISGVAESLAGEFGRNYFAGHWEEELLRSLVWCVEGDIKEGKTVRPPYRAPSWSWASVKGLVSPGDWEIPPNTAICEVVDVQTTTPYGPFGPVEDGFLRLACPYLLKGKVECGCAESEFNHTVEFERGDGDGTFGWPVRMDTVPCEAPDSVGDVRGSRLECTVYAVVLFPQWAVLLKPDNRRQGSFRRVGIASGVVGKSLTPGDLCVNEAARDCYEGARYLFDAGGGDWVAWPVVTIF